jgi:hypothetical protein
VKEYVSAHGRIGDVREEDDEGLLPAHVGLQREGAGKHAFADSPDDRSYESGGDVRQVRAEKGTQPAEFESRTRLLDLERRDSGQALWDRRQSVRSGGPYDHRSIIGTRLDIAEKQATEQRPEEPSRSADQVRRTDATDATSVEG